MWNTTGGTSKEKHGSIYLLDAHENRMFQTGTGQAAQSIVSQEMNAAVTWLRGHGRGRGHKCSSAAFG